MNYPDKPNERPELIYGLSGIGKTYFVNDHWSKKERILKKASGKILWTGAPSKVVPLWFEKLYTRVIVLGAPYLIWLQRIKDRSIMDPRRRNCVARFNDKDKFKESYVEVLADSDTSLKEQYEKINESYSKE